VTGRCTASATYDTASLSELQRTELLLEERRVEIAVKKRAVELELAERRTAAEKELIRDHASALRVKDALLLADLKSHARSRPGSVGRPPTDWVETGDFTIAKPSKPSKPKVVELGDADGFQTDEETDRDRLEAEWEEAGWENQARIRELYFEHNVPLYEAIAKITRGE
jgi:hypothetical protein